MDPFESEPVWVQSAIQRLESLGYTVQCEYDVDGQSWQNKVYTVTKGTLTYLVRGRALQLLRIGG